MIVKYRTFVGRIDRVELVGETPHQVIKANGRREAKSCDSWQYHDSFEAARKFLFDACAARIDDLKRRLKSEEKTLSTLFTLKDPDMPDAT